VLAALATVVLVRFAGQVLSAGVLIVLSLMLAAALQPIVAWLERHRIGRGLASLIGVALVALIGLGLLALVVPVLVVQAVDLVQSLPDVVDHLRSRLEDYPAVFDALETRAVELGGDPMALFTGVFRFGLNAVTLLFGIVLLLTITLYFLVDRDRIRAAVLRHVPDTYRGRVELTLSETARVVRAYFIGQVIISSIFAVFTFVLLTVLGVPYATVFAALAFFLDAIPNIGSFLATILPGLVALTQSVTTAVIVVAAILIYNQIEINLIQPRVLGGRLDIPPVLTIIAILVGGRLFGITGIIIAIPIAGVLPVIDRIWITGEMTAPQVTSTRARRRGSGRGGRRSR